MEGPSAAEALVDAYVDLVLRGSAPDIEGYIAAHAELGPEEAKRLRKLARALGSNSSGPVAGASDLPFESIGPYRLIERLGAGGMGVVFLAEDTRLGRRVALKLVRPELSGSTDTLARFEREVRAVAKLRHPNIVTVFEAGRERDVPFLVMDLVPGSSMDERLARARAEHRLLSADECVRWARDIARALEHAHAAGVIHRDVKPSNIRITPEDRALLLDFGLALDPNAASISRTGQVHGTLHYVSPEQVGGRSSELDARADVWSLGVTLYEALAGRVPFDGEHSEAILLGILTAEPVSLRELVPDLPRDVETVVMKALEKDRARRYGSAADLADDLQAILDHRPIRARPTNAFTKVWKWSRRKPGHAAALTLAVTMVVGGPLAYAFVQRRHAEALALETARAQEQEQLALEQRRVAEEQERLAHERALELEGMVDFQGDVLTSIEPRDLGVRFLDALRAESRKAWERAGANVDEIARHTAELDTLVRGASTTNAAVAVLRSNVLDPALAAIRERFADQPKVQGMLLHSTAMTCMHVGLLDLAIDTQQRAFELLESSMGRADADTLSVEANLGYYLMAVGRTREAEPHLRHAASELPQAVGAESAATLSAQNNLAMLLRGAGRYEEAEALTRELLVVRRRVLGDDAPDTLKTLGNLGALLMQTGRDDEAAPLLAESYVRRGRALGLANESTLITANNLAVMWTRRGRVLDAEPLLQVNYERSRDAHGDRHPVTLHLLTSLAETEVAAQCYESAEAHFRSALAGAIENLGLENADTLTIVRELGDCLTTMGKLEEARALLEPAYERACATIGEDHADARGLVSDWAQLLRRIGRPAESARLLGNLIDYSRVAGRAREESTLSFQAERALAWIELRQFADAERALTAVHADLESVGKRSPRIERALVALYTAWQAHEPSAERAEALAHWRSRTAP